MDRRRFNIGYADSGPFKLDRYYYTSGCGELFSEKYRTLAFACPVSSFLKIDEHIVLTKERVLNTSNYISHETDLETIGREFIYRVTIDGNTLKADRECKVAVGPTLTSV